MCTTSGISPSFLGLSRSSGQITHVLLTRSRLGPRASPGSSHHLHVLSTPPAFVLSQDQTLRERYFLTELSYPVAAGYTNSATGMTVNQTARHADVAERIGLKHSADPRVHGVHAAQFSKTAAPPRRDSPLFTHGARHEPAPRGTREYSAAGAVCLGGRAKPTEAALADLQDPAVQRRRLEVEAVGGDRLAVQLHTPLLDQAPGLARADLEGLGHQQR
jgi:hypothetical protein